MIIIGTMFPSDSLPPCPHFGCPYRFQLYFLRKWRGGSPQFRKLLSHHVASHTPRDSWVLFQVLYTVHGLRPTYKGSTSPWPQSGFFWRSCRIHFMLQPDGLLAQLSLVLYHRASTLEFLHQLSDSYRAPWRLLGLDFHQLAIYGLLGTHMSKKPLSLIFGGQRLFQSI